MIYGERIRFRSPEREHLPLFTRWLDDPEVRVGILTSLPMSLASEEQWFEKMIKRPSREQTLTIELEEKDQWIPIGNCGFHNFDDAARSAGLGIMIGEKDYREKGYGTEAVKLLLKVGFEIHNLNRIALEVFSNNPRAIHVYEKVGFIHEARQRQAMYKNGKYIDNLVMSVLREEWKGAP